MRSSTPRAVQSKLTHAHGMSYSNLTDYPLPRVEESLLTLGKRLAQLNTRHERHSGVEPAVSSILARTRLTRPTLLPNSQSDGGRQPPRGMESIPPYHPRPCASGRLARPLSPCSAAVKGQRPQNEEAVMDRPPPGVKTGKPESYLRFLLMGNRSFETAPKQRYLHSLDHQDRGRSHSTTAVRRC